jgi:hypothetical protein
MEQHFGHEFGDVRVHTGAHAAATAAAVEADAFAFGTQLVFGGGRYRPDTAAGAKLIAHELAHVVQQRSTGAELARQPLTSWDPFGIGPPAPAVQTYDPLALVDPSAVVVGGVGPSGAPPDDPLRYYPTLATILATEDYERLRTAVRARTAAQAAAGIGGEPVRSAPKLRRLRAQARLTSPRPTALATLPLASLAGIDAQYVTADFSTALVPYLLMPRPPERAIALVMRNEVVRRLMTRWFPAGSTVDVSLEDPEGHVPGLARLAFVINAHAVQLPLDGFFHLEQLDEAAGRPIPSLRDDVVHDAERLADYAALVLRARKAIDMAPGLTSGVSSSPEAYSLSAVRGFRDDLATLAQDIATFSSDLVTPQLMAELYHLRDQLAPLGEPLARALAKLEELHTRTATGATVEEAAQYQDKLARESNDGSIGGSLRAAFWAQGAADTRMSNLLPGSSAMDQAVLAYRAGDISLSSFHSIMLHQTIRMAVGVAVGVAAGLLGAYLGAAAGAAVFGTETLGASISAGAGGGLFAGTGQLAGEDIYGATISALSSDPAVAASLRSTAHTGGEYLFAGATGLILGGFEGGLTFTPRPAQPPIVLLDAAGRPQLVSGGQILPPRLSTAPVRLWTGETESVLVQGGQVVATPPPSGPAQLFGPTGQSMLVQGGQVVSPSATTLAGGSRVVTPQGLPVSGLRPPISPLLDPFGNPLPVGSGGPVVLDLQSGQAAFLRDITARIPGSRGIGVESGDWLLGYQGIHPTNPADLALSRALVRSTPIWPDAPAWRTPVEQVPRSLGWEMDPGGFFWPQTGPVRVLPEPFFPALGGGGRLVPRGFTDIAAIQATTHPELHGIADQIYLRRPFGLGSADPGVTRALGQELNSMLKTRGFVELRLTRQGEFRVPPAGSAGIDQLAIVASQIEGATIERVDAAAIRAFARGQTPRGLSSIQLEMLQNAASDLGGAGALGQGDIVRIIRIYKGTPPQQILLVGPETPAEFSWAADVASQGHQVTAANPIVTPAARAFIERGGKFVAGPIESLPRAPTLNLIREDFPVPLARMPQPVADFATARIERLAPGGRWIVVTEAPEFATTLRYVADQQGMEVTRYELPAAHEAAPQSAYPRETSRVMLIIEKPR